MIDLKDIKFWKMADTFTGLKLQGEIGKFGKSELSDIVGYVQLPDGKVLSGSESGILLLWEGNIVKCEVSSLLLLILQFLVYFLQNLRRTAKICLVSNSKVFWKEMLYTSIFFLYLLPPFLSFLSFFIILLKLFDGR